MSEPFSTVLPSPAPAASVSPPDGWDEPAAGFAGAPDSKLIAQLANALFQSWPGQSMPSIGVAPPSVPFIEAAPPPVPAGTLQVPQASIPALPPVPTGLPQAEAPEGYYFLESLPQRQPQTAVPPIPNGFDTPVTLAESQPSAQRPASPPQPFTAPASAPAAALYFVDEGFGVSTRAEPPDCPDAPAAQPNPLGVELQPHLVPDLAGTGHGVRAFDAHSIKQDFPILQEKVHGKPLIWLDNAATTQKPRQVIDRISRFYEHENSNIHRAAHALAARSTDAYEAAREKVRRFLNAGSTEEIIFVRGATEGINLIAKAWGGRNVKEGDEIVVTWLEHHANIVPWQQLCAQTGARLRVAPVDDSGQIILEEYEKLLGPSTRIVSLTQVSNALGTVTPAAEMVAIAHRHGAVVLVDGAQAVSHMPVDVQALDADFYVFSGHKVFGPTGIGAVYGKKAILDNMPPWQGGGNMIADVTFEKTVYQPAPARFEAGTGNIADAVGLGAAIDYLDTIGMANVAAWEHQLLEYGTQGLLSVPGLRLIGTAKEKAGVLSFVIDECRTEDIGKALDRDGIAVRSGHHCAQPILRRFGLEATVRPSLALYNTFEDIDALVAALLRIQSGRGKRWSSS